MNRMIVMSLVICIILVMLTGCQESNANLIQRARLVGNENLKLKKQLEEKDLQIAQLQKDIEKLEAEKLQETQKSGDTNFRLLQLLGEAEKNKETLMQENEALKAELEKLKTQ